MDSLVNLRVVISALNNRPIPDPETRGWRQTLSYYRPKCGGWSLPCIAILRKCDYISRITLVVEEYDKYGRIAWIVDDGIIQQSWIVWIISRRRGFHSLFSFGVLSNQNIGYVHFKMSADVPTPCRKRQWVGGISGKIHSVPKPHTYKIRLWLKYYKLHPLNSIIS